MYVRVGACRGARTARFVLMRSTPMQHSPNHRDLDTLRGLIQETLAPPPEEPKAALNTSILIASAGVVLGCVIGVVAIQNAKTAKAPMLVAAAAAAPATPTATPAAVAIPKPAPTSGTVDVDGPAGANVFDGDQLVGKVPLTFTTSLGEHTLRIEEAKTKKKSLVKVTVTDRGVASVRIDAPKHAPRIHIAHGGGGTVVHGPRTTRPASGGSDLAAAQADLAEARTQTNNSL